MSVRYFVKKVYKISPFFVSKFCSKKLLFGIVSLQNLLTSNENLGLKYRPQETGEGSLTSYPKNLALLI